MTRVQGFAIAGMTGTTGSEGTLTTGLEVATDESEGEDPVPLGAGPAFEDVEGATRPVANRFGDTVARMTGAVLGAPT